MTTPQVRTVADGFVTSPYEIAAIVVIFVGLLGVFLVYALRKRRLREAQRTEANAARYRELVQMYQLSPSDEDLIARMARRLKRQDEPHVFLENQGLFNRAARLLMSEDGVSTGWVSGLRVKLRFTGKPIGMQLYSSVDIPPDSSLLLRTIRGTTFGGTVADTAKGTLHLRLGPNPPSLPRGTQLHVVYQNQSGVFEFDTAVLSAEGTELHLQHSEHIEKHQQRHHYRRAIDLPVGVTPLLSDDPPLVSHFVDIGGGGASLINPEKRFRSGDTFHVTFAPEGEQEISVLCTVLRTSRHNEVLHVEYGPIREATRDRIYRLLFQAPGQKGRHGGSDGPG
jgi:hypothetical protein